MAETIELSDHLTTETAIQQMESAIDRIEVVTHSNLEGKAHLQTLVEAIERQTQEEQDD